MDKTKHIYSEDVNLEIHYTYNNEYKKVYDIKSVKRSFNLILEKMRRK
jgi:hypothetical protein